PPGRIKPILAQDSVKTAPRNGSENAPPRRARCSPRRTPGWRQRWLPGHRTVRLRPAVWEAPERVPQPDPFRYTHESPPDVAWVGAVIPAVYGGSRSRWRVPQQTGSVCGRFTPYRTPGQYVT